MIMLDEKMVKLLNDNAVDVNELSESNGHFAECEWQTPAGEDFIFTINAESTKEFVKELSTYAEEFDEEEHVEMLWEAKKNGFMGVPSLKELVQDADEIKQFLNDIAKSAEALEKKIEKSEKNGHSKA